MLHDLTTDTRERKEPDFCRIFFSGTADVRLV